MAAYPGPPEMLSHMPKNEADVPALTPDEIATLQSAAQGGPGGKRVTLWTRLIAEHAARGRRIAEFERLLNVVDHSVGAALRRIDAVRPLGVSPPELSPDGARIDASSGSPQNDG